MRQKLPVVVRYSLMTALSFSVIQPLAVGDEWRSRTANPASRTTSQTETTSKLPATVADAARQSDHADTVMPSVARNAHKAVPLNAVVIKTKPADADLSQAVRLPVVRQTSAQDDSVHPASRRVLTIPTTNQQVGQDSPEHSTTPAAPNTLPSPSGPSSFGTSQSAPSQSSQSATDAGAFSASALPSTSYTWSDSYQARMQNVVPKHAAGTQQDCDIAVWWHDQAVEYQASNRRLVHAVVQPQKVRAFVDDHTLPPQIEPDQPLYDSRPRLIELGPVRPAAAQDGVRESSHVDRLTRDITQIQPTLSYALEGIREDQLPDDFFEKMDNGAYVARHSAPTVLQWAPTNLWHYPLYFEDPALERYGHTYHPLIQPFASSGLFATQLVGLPYQMTLHPIHSKEYTLGWYRPGDFAPKKYYQIPFNEEATLMQIAVVAGMILIFP